MKKLWRPSPKVVVEDPEALGYRLVADVLLDVMSGEEWLALERRALEAADAPPRSS